MANNASNSSGAVVGTQRVKRGMAEQLKNGVIMDVVTPEQVGRASCRERVCSTV